ncbi:GGDEF domain-containing protein [Ferrovibrio sp.]|uniref:GGDEF domain-containing protein n=1 Tax=Ferrovibrio sp. TaxID=1917215 RepID=UPI0026020A5E|nr:GGDEF domain-containing protein [Ferrovibrio sp.]
MPGMIGVDNLPIIALATIAVAVINTLIMTGVTAVHPREAGPSTWALANITFGVGLAILVLRKPGNEPIVALSGNILFVIGYILFWFGSRQFRGQPLPWRPAAALLAAFLVPFCWFLFVTPDVAMRAAVVAGVIAMACACIAWSMLYRIETGLMQTQALIGLLFGMLSTLYLMRLFAALSGQLELDGLRAGPLGNGIFLIPALASLLATIACALMVSQRLQQRLQSSVRTDQLTGLVNRGLLDEIGAKEISRARRHGYGLSAIILDIDHFEAINRQKGYAFGDAVLRQIAGIIGTNMRREDYLARIDGATFCILLPSTRLGGAQQLAERLRQQIAAAAQHDNRASGTITASFGIATLGLHGDDWASLVRRAETALGRAKTEGRNRVSVAMLSETGLDPA